MGDGNFGKVDGEKAACGAENFGFWLDGRDGTESDEFVAVETDAGILIFEEFF